MARVALARQIVQNIAGSEPSVPVIRRDPQLEQILLGTVQQAQKSGVDASAFIEPSLAERLQRSLVAAAQKQEVAGKPLVLLVAAPLRMMLSRFARHSVPDLQVLAYTEIRSEERRVGRGGG